MNAMDGSPPGRKPTTEPKPVTAACRGGDLGLAPNHCGVSPPLEPCTVIIFGASGDLTARKLIPALFNLYRTGGLPQPFRIVGCARTAMTREQFRARF